MSTGFHVANINVTVRTCYGRFGTSNGNNGCGIEGKLRWNPRLREEKVIRFVACPEPGQEYWARLSHSLCGSLAMSNDHGKSSTKTPFWKLKIHGCGRELMPRRPR